jgi:hypothetical protein
MGGRGAELYDREKTWSSVNYLILYNANHPEQLYFLAVFRIRIHLMRIRSRVLMTKN